MEHTRELSAHGYTRIHTHTLLHTVFVPLSSSSVFHLTAYSQCGSTLYSPWIDPLHRHPVNTLPGGWGGEGDLHMYTLSRHTHTHTRQHKRVINRPNSNNQLLFCPLPQGDTVVEV